MSDHVLICDDEPDLREMLSEFLGKRGFRTTCAANAVELRALLEVERPDVILLDINMPGEDGLSVLRGLQGPDAPFVIMLTAAGEVVDRVVGLEMGADDYLAKPVDLRELASRVKAVLRRRATKSAEPVGERSRFRFGRTWLDLEAAKLIDEDGQEVPLTSMEFNLLKLFARNRGRVLGAHDRSWDPYDRSIDIRISRIRKKIEANPARPEVIRTVRGLGYIYDPT